MAEDQEPSKEDDTSKKEPSHEGSNSVDPVKKEPPIYDPKPKKQAPGAQEKDAADNPIYDAPDSEKKDLDSQILAKHKIGKWMTITAAVFLLLFTATFFIYAIYFAHGFLEVLGNHIHAYQKSKAEISILPFLMPFMPATLFAALGVATMVTAMRFINAYVNTLDERNDGIFIIEKTISEIAKAAKNFKSGGSD